MKKNFIKILITILSVCFTMACFTACGGTGWSEKDVSLKNPGAVVSDGGFLAETENYVYFINGVGDYSSNNQFGTPVKGALVAAEKNDLTKTCVVVPKLFASTDYNAGVYIFSEGNDLGYVYYGTPSTSKDSSGQVATTELIFMRTKLDGTGTEEFFSVSGLETEYRIVKGDDGDVYIVYYNTKGTELVSYNTSTKEKTVICKTDEKAEKRSLSSYKFMDNEGTSGAVVVYTTTVYTAEYDEAQAGYSDYSRSTASYNEVFAYKVGDTSTETDCYGKKVLTGDLGLGKNPITYTLSFANSEYLFYTTTDSAELDTNLQTKTYAIKTDALYNTETATLIKNVDAAVEANIIVSLEEVYYLDSTAKRIKKTTLIGNVSLEEINVADGETATTLFAVEGDYVYYYNATGEIARIKVKNVNEANESEIKEHVVSHAVVAATWYAPKFVDGKIYYADNNTNASNYVYAVSIDAAVKYNEDDETYYLDGGDIVGVITDADRAKFVEDKITNISTALVSGAIVLEEDEEGELVCQEVIDARAEYQDYLSKATDKGLVSSEMLDKLAGYEEGVRISKIMYKLYDFDFKTDAEKDALEQDYLAVKQALEDLEASDEFEYDDIFAYVENNLKWYYQEASEYFAE